MSARSELQEVQPLHIHDIDSRNVPERLHEFRAFSSVDNEWAFPVDVAAVTHFTFTGTDGVAVLGFIGVGSGTDMFQGLESRGGLLEALGRVADNEWELGDRLDAVTACLHERRNSGGGDGRNEGVALEIHVDLAVPAAPNLGGSEHSATATHVSEGTLASAVGTASGDTGDTGHRASGTPGLGGGLVSGALGHSVGLAFIVGDLGVDEVDDVGSDRGLHDIG